ncbi:MAG: HAMP domain-containing sensor histidine kinase [Pirellulaceae bacterium]
MFERSSLRLPITLGVVMIVLLVALLVGWIVLAVVVAFRDPEEAGWYWALLTIGAVFFVFILVGVVMYLTLSVKAINLSRRQSNFIDAVTHELKSPIASLKLYLQTLRRRSLSDEERDSFEAIMLDDVERLDLLINQLLTAARLERGDAADASETLRIDTLVRSCVEDVCLRYRQAASIVQLQLVPCETTCRAVDLDLILRNIIDNAVKYAGDDPQVTILLCLKGQDAELLIEDNGRGIPPPLRRKVFRRFVRLGLELERDKPGTGLGLYIVRTLIKKLNGTIRIRDRASGPGTLFEVVIPNCTDPKALSGAENEPE